MFAPRLISNAALLQIATINLLEHLQHLQCALVCNAIMQCLRGPPECDQAIGAQFAQMLRQRRLAQFHDANKLSTVISPRAARKQRISSRFSLPSNFSSCAASPACFVSFFKSAASPVPIAAGIVFGVAATVLMASCPDRICAQGKAPAPVSRYCV